MAKLSLVPQGREIILPNIASPPPRSAGGQQKKKNRNYKSTTKLKIVKKKLVWD